MKVLITFLLVLFPVSAVFPEDKKPEAKKAKKPKTVAGKADVLRHVKKHFASFRESDGEGGIVLQIEGEEAESKWSIKPDAEVKIHGWWGRTEQLQRDDRVWVWFAVDRAKKPVSILMIADEVSEQDIHGFPYSVQKVEADRVTVHFPGDKKVPARELTYPGGSLEVNEEQWYLQTSGKTIRVAWSGEEFSEKQSAQKDWLRERWRSEGLPGSITFLHALSGEMEVFLDHEAIRWGRYLKNGNTAKLIVTSQKNREIETTVKFVEPWRERTRVRLVTKSGMDQVDLQPGTRILLKVPEPPLEIQNCPYPTDISRLTDKDDRVEWFLQSVYCPCGIARDRCTGMFYTLASCNENACGGPNEMRAIIRSWFDEGMTDDKAIYDRLKKERSVDIARPHLLR